MHSSFERPFDTQKTAEQIRHETTLLCPDNDPEARLILLIAQRAGIRVLASSQRHGATLSQEPALLDRVTEAGRPHVWIVEIPGPEREEALRGNGFSVEIIDHHQYNTEHLKMDRTKDVETGERSPSSLEQFLKKAKITDDELVEWGFDPLTVYGIGIMDDQYVFGLRRAGYQPEEIKRVLRANILLSHQINPDLEKITEGADFAWENRQSIGEYTLVTSPLAQDIRAAISLCAVEDQEDTHPLIISTCAGKKIYVQNVAQSVTTYLLENLPGKKFTFGAGRCWGVDSTDPSTTPVTLEEVIRALEKAPSPLEG